MKTFIGISGFQKTDADSVLFKSALENNYQENGNEFGYSDDNNGEKYWVDCKTNPTHPIFLTLPIEYESFQMKSSVDIFEEFKKECKLTLMYGKRGGVSINKNRLIYTFLKSKCEYLLLLDNDQRFIKPGLIEEMIEVLGSNKLNHITGKWVDEGEEKTQITGKGWTETFPVMALGDRITWHTGCHGNICFFTRQAIENLLYYDQYALYGYEHDTYSSRAMRIMGRSPSWKPQFSRSQKYMVGQNIANNYGGTEEEIKKADPLWQARCREVWEGKDLQVKNHGLNLSKEVILE